VKLQRDKGRKRGRRRTDEDHIIQTYCRRERKAEEEKDVSPRLGHKKQRGIVRRGYFVRWKNEKERQDDTKEKFGETTPSASSGEVSTDSCVGSQEDGGTAGTYKLDGGEKEGQGVGGGLVGPSS